MKLIQLLTGGSPPNDTLCCLLSFSVRMGEVGLSPPEDLGCEFAFSHQISSPLVSCIIRQDMSYTSEVFNAQLRAKSEVKRQRQENLNAASSSIIMTLFPRISKVLWIWLQRRVPPAGYLPSLVPGVHRWQKECHLCMRKIFPEIWEPCHLVFFCVWITHNHVILVFFRVMATCSDSDDEFPSALVLRIIYTSKGYSDWKPWRNDCVVIVLLFSL